MSKRPSSLRWVAGVVALLGAASVNAANIAVFGNNGMLTYINASTPHTGTLVTDAQLAVAGFLNGFDAFVYTRDGASGSPAPTMSAASAANVSSYVQGNIVLFNGDFSDAVGIAADAGSQTLFSNALDFVSGGGGGYIGELFGFAAAFQSNDNGVPALGLVAGDVNGNFVGDNGDVTLEPAGVGHPVTNGVTFPFNPVEWDLAFDVSGYDANAVLASHPSGRPAILAFGAVVPEPGTLALLGGGLLLVARARRRQA